MTAFVVGSAYAGAAGAFFASWQGFLGPESFGVDLSLGIFVMLILGGTGSVWGGVIGAAFYVWLPEWLRAFDQYKELTYGVVLLVAIILLPEGIIGIATRVRRLAPAALRGRASPPSASTDPLAKDVPR
jgi:branched-chain amino acid transport system permease protein